MEKKSQRKSKPAPVAVKPEPKPQIPTMLQALRREREKARALVEALEAKLASVLRPNADALIGVATEGMPDAAPVAQSLCESVAIFASLNARLRDIAARVEL